MKQVGAARDSDSPSTMSWQSLQAKMATIKTTAGTKMRDAHVILVGCVLVEAILTREKDGRISPLGQLLLGSKVDQ